MLFNVSSDAHLPEYVNVLIGEVGKGVHAVRPYPAMAVIGEITGDLFKDPYEGTDCTFEALEGYQLEPYEPFRYVNHSCDPNCDFAWIETPAFEDQPAHAGLFLAALRPIVPEEELTIDYRWPASCAIPCKCRASTCRGWVVDESELEALRFQLRVTSDE